MKKILVDKPTLLTLLEKFGNIKQVQEAIGCSRNTVKLYMKKYEIPTPRGFYKTGKPVGRPKGIPTTDEQKQMLSLKFSGEGNPFYGQKHTPDSIAKMSGPRPNISGENNPFHRACIENPALREIYSEFRMDKWANMSTEDRYKQTSKCICGDIAKGHWSRIISNARVREIGFFITPEEAWTVWIAQGGRCALSGVELNMKSCYEVTASLDRIDSYNEYSYDNIQWIHKDLNIMKGCLTTEEFVERCLSVASYSLRNTI